VPCGETLPPSGYSPLVKIGTTLSQYLNRLRSMGWSTPRGSSLLCIQYSMSAMSRDSGCVAMRLTSASLAAFCISILKPRSAVACRAMSMIDEYDPPTWSRAMSLMFCAQIVGKPLIAPEPTARPAAAAAPLSIGRRLMPARSVAAGRRPDFAILLAICASFAKIRRTGRPPFPLSLESEGPAWPAGARIGSWTLLPPPDPVKRGTVGPSPARSGRDHLLFDADPGGAGAFVFQRHRRRILQRDPGRIEEGDVAVGEAARFPADDHLADLAHDVALLDQALGERHVDLAVRAALPDVVDEDAGALQDLRVELLVAALVGADRRDVRAGRDPRVLDDRAARRRHGDDHVGAAHDRLEVGGRADRQIGKLGPLARHEGVEGRGRAAPHP